MEAIVAGTRPSSVSIDAFAISALSNAFCTLVDILALTSVSTWDVASIALAVPAAIGIHTAAIVAFTFASFAFIDVSALQLDGFRLVAVVTKTHWNAFFVGHANSLFTKSF